MKKLCEQKGSFTIEGAIIMLVGAACIILAINVLGVANTAMKLQAMAGELVRYTEVRGRVDGPVYAELARLEAASGIDVDCTITADYISGTNKVQFGDNITISLTTQKTFGVGGVVRIPITLRTVANGRSELYWK